MLYPSLLTELRMLSLWIRRSQPAKCIRNSYIDEMDDKNAFVQVYSPKNNLKVSKLRKGMYFMKHKQFVLFMKLIITLAFIV